MDYKSLRKKTGHSLLRSIKQELSYINAVIAHPTTVIYKHKEFHLVPPKTFQISPSMYERNYTCLDHPGCDLCCVGFHSLFLSKSLSKQNLDQLKSMWVNMISIQVQGRSNLYYTFNHQNPSSDCSFRTSKGCSIYKECPITCLFPLIRFRKYKDEKIILMKTQWTRRWAMPCPVEFKPYYSHDQFLQDTLWKFQNLERYMDALELPHIVRHIINVLSMRITGELDLDSLF